MKPHTSSLVAALTVVALASAPGVAHTTVAEVRAASPGVVVIGPFPLEVYDGLMQTEPLVVEVAPGTYFNLGFFEVDAAAGELWPFGLGLVREAHVRLAPPLARAR